MHCQMCLTTFTSPLLFDVAPVDMSYRLSDPMTPFQVAKLEQVHHTTTYAARQEPDNHKGNRFSLDSRYGSEPSSATETCVHFKNAQLAVLVQTFDPQPYWRKLGKSRNSKLPEGGKCVKCR